MVFKTVEAEKEAFLCTYKQNKPTQILDVMLFTEIFEKISSGKVIKKNVESISCLKDISTAKVLKCYTKTFINSSNPIFFFLSCYFLE